MSKKGSAVPTLRVPMTTTDEQLVKVLEEVLPDLLIKKEGISPLQARQAAKSLAWEIVQAARRCNDAHRVNDVANRIMLNQPSPQECKDFKAAVDKIIKIRMVPEIRPRTSPVKNLAGSLWYLLTERVLGIPPKSDDGANAAVGIRG